MIMFPTISYNAQFFNGIKSVLTYLLLYFPNEVKDFV